MDNAGITIATVKEAIGFIEHMWRAWTGDLHMFMANVISDDRVCVYDVRALVHALSERSQSRVSRTSLLKSKVQTTQSNKSVNGDRKGQFQSRDTLCNFRHQNYLS